MKNWFGITATFITGFLLIGCNSNSSKSIEQMNRDSYFQLTRCIDGRSDANKQFPRQMISLAVRENMADSMNVVLGDIYSRCTEENDVHIFRFCVKAAQRNSVGYLSKPNAFFGSYDKGIVRITASGAPAQAACDRLVSQ